MKKIFVILLFSLSFISKGQFGILIENFNETGVSYFDNFNSYTLGSDLNGQDGWVAIINSIRMSGSDYLWKGNTASQISLYWKPDSLTITDDQSGEMFYGFAATTGAYVGIALRVNNTSGGNAYVYMISTNATYFGKIINGSVSSIATGTPTTSSTGTIKMTIEGNEIRCYLDGSLDVSLTGGTGIFNDTSIPSGKGVGIASYDSGNVYGDNWDVGDF